MAITKKDLDELKTELLPRSGGAVQGDVFPSEADAFDLGKPDQRWNTIYAKQVVADSVSGGGSGGDADTVDGYHASLTPTPGYLLPLDPATGAFPDNVYPNALKVRKSPPLEENLVVRTDVTIDGIDLDIHNHNGMPGRGERISHWDLLDNEADVHPQYAERGADEIITGRWRFVKSEDLQHGWRFNPDIATSRIQAEPYPLVLETSTASARLWLGNNQEILMSVSNTDISFRVGVGGNVAVLSATDATYRLWIGSNDPSLAPFKVSKSGDVYASSGRIGGFDILLDRIQGQNLKLVNTGDIYAGSETENNGRYDLVRISGTNADGWRFWAGHPDPASATFKIDRWGNAYFGSAFVSGALMSSNYQAGTNGFILRSDGYAEFNNVSVRGRLDTVVYAENKVSVVGGRLVISLGTTLTRDLSPSDNVIYVGEPVFSKNDIVFIQPSAQRNEYMWIVSDWTLTEVGDYAYTVVRNLEESEPKEFYKGETLVRLGSASYQRSAHPIASGDPESAFGALLPGGSGSETSGGWLVLEGGREFAPYFGVVRRVGGRYNQYEDVVRIGNIGGLAVVQSLFPESQGKSIWGVFIGDDAQHMVYDPEHGLRIITRSGNTSIDQDGIQTDVFNLVDSSRRYKWSASLSSYDLYFTFTDSLSSNRGRFRIYSNAPQQIDADDYTLELRVPYGTDYGEISLRFNQDNRFAHTIRARQSGFYLKTWDANWTNLYAGSVYVNGALSVSSSTTLSSGLSVSGSTTLGGTTINGNLGLNGNLVATGSGHTLSLSSNGGGRLVLANNTNDNAIYLEGFNKDGNGHATAMHITGANAGNIPQLYLKADSTYVLGGLTVSGVLTPSGGLSAGSVTESALASGTRKFIINVLIGNGIQPISTGVKACIRLPQFSFTITRWEIVSVDSTTGSITIDLRVNVFSSTPSSSGSICGSNKPTMSNAIRASGSTSGWSLPISADRWMTINVDNASGVKLISLALICTN